MPVAWIILYNGTEATIDYFLATLCAQNPKVIPKYLMTDFNKAQINAIKHHYPESQLLLCWWHVAHVWQQHFVTAHYKDLWAELKKWYQLATKADFDTCWERIQALAPASIIKYITQYWLPHVHLWSAVYREGCSIFEQCDMNMLVEAEVQYYFPINVHWKLTKFHSWHHVLKGKMLEGKRNCWIDNLIHILIHKAIPHFSAKHWWQEFGFEGPDLEVQQWNEAEANTCTFTHDNVEELVKGQLYSVKSQSDPAHNYHVNNDNYTCNCNSYPSILYCKHLCAMQFLFPESMDSQPFISLNTQPKKESSPVSDDDTSPVPTSTAYDVAAITPTRICNKLQTLAIHTQLAPAPSSNSVHYSELESLLDIVLVETQGIGILL